MENGATAPEATAILGWAEIGEIHTRRADRKRLAAQAMEMLGT